ncbi:hypothetical protein GCM10027597_62040 [Saccharopolyspora tripterygii]
MFAVFVLGVTLICVVGSVFAYALRLSFLRYVYDRGGAHDLAVAADAVHRSGIKGQLGDDPSSQAAG